MFLLQTPASSIKAKQLPAITADPSKQKAVNGKKRHQYHHVMAKAAQYRIDDHTMGGLLVIDVMTVKGNNTNPTSRADNG